jgi:succinate-acetate transporter protein
MSYATILLPGSGIIDSYANAPPTELSNALGIYLTAWGIFTFFML